MENKYFSILLPPPNLTGVLHIGHLWNATIQDFIGRKKQLEGFNIFWQLGVDHAGLSLQSKFESDMKKQNISLNEENYNKKIIAWKDANFLKIKTQYEAINVLIDTKQYLYTLDVESISITLKIFKKLYDEGLIYKDKKIINWDKDLQSVISDSEIITKNEEKTLYFLKYYLSDNSGEHLLIATSRPETIFADQAIFINPNDERYTSFINKKVLIPIINREIPILQDESIDISFGTGVMKCTPGHDQFDWELGLKHKLKPIICIDNGIFNKECGKYQNNKWEKVKDEIIAQICNKQQQYVSKVYYSIRSNSIVEPKLSSQWFLSVKPLIKKLEKNLTNAKDLFYEKKYLDITKNILLNMHDWCISRQIKWGIQIPIFIHKKTNEIICSLENQDESLYTQIPDRLDTWFTSSLWPLIVMNYHKTKTPSLTLPFDLISSGKDILLFWIIKMLLMSSYSKNIIPFKKIFLHGLILDKQGKKMSKSLNNGVLPEDLINKYGSDSVRLFLLLNTFEDSNIKFLESKIDYSRRFLQKLKNIFLFFKNNNLFIEGYKEVDISKENIEIYEIDILNKMHLLEEESKNSNIAYICNKWTKFLWHDIGNWYLELLKININIKKLNNKKFISYLWKQIFLNIYPIIPYFVESSFENVYKFKICESKFSQTQYFPSLSCDNWFRDYINLVREIYADLKINEKTKKYEVNLIFEEKEKEDFDEKIINTYLPYFDLVNQKIVSILNKNTNNKNFINVFLTKTISIEILVDDPEYISKYKSWVIKKDKFYEFEVNRSTMILMDKNFLNKAEYSIIESEKEKLKNYQSQSELYKQLKKAF